MNYVLHLNGGSIDSGNASCLGSQLSNIINLISKITGNLNWYSIDVQKLGSKTNPLKNNLIFCGDSICFAENLKHVGQFLSGTFFGVNQEYKSPQLRNQAYTVEPNCSPLFDATVELRAFDTSYIEIITMEKKIIESLSCQFGINYFQSE